MAVRSIHLGPVEDFIQFEDSEFYSDGITPRGLIVPIAPTVNNAVVRLQDLTSSVNPLANDAVLLAEGVATDFANGRFVTVGGGLTKTDGGAGGNYQVSLPSPFTSGNVLSANGSVFVSLSRDAAGLVDKVNNQTGIAGNKTWTGNNVFQTAVDSTTGFQVLDADGGTPIINIDTANERVGIGTSAPQRSLDVVGDINFSGTLRNTNITGGPLLLISSTTSNESDYRVYNNNQGFVSNLVYGYRAGGSFASPAATPSNSVSIDYRAIGHTGSAFGSESARFQLFVEGGSAGSTPGYMTFRTTPSGQTSGIERLRLLSDGNLQIRRNSSTQNREISSLVNSWVDSTDATRKGRLVFNVYDTSAREVIRIESNGAAMFGAFGVAAVNRPTAYTQTYATATKTHAARTAVTLTDNSGGVANATVEALPDPADAPLTADALRDDLVANLIPALRNNFADIVAQINAIKVDSDNTAQFSNQMCDDHQALGWLS